MHTLTKTNASIELHVNSAEPELHVVTVEDGPENCAISTTLEPAAKAHVIVIQATNTPVTITQQNTLASGAELTVHNITLGSGRVEQSVVNELSAADAAASINWIFYAKNKENYHLTAQNVFNGRDGGGTINLRGVAEDSANVRCDGLIDIGLEGGGTNTYLTEEVLMLDPTATVEAVPGLEIKTNDVKASHSATVSRVTEEDLFYFGARGIAPVTARKMYIEGFLGSLLESLPLDIQEQVAEAIDTKYTTG